jgi:hypothetical protein
LRALLASAALTSAGLTALLTAARLLAPASAWILVLLIFVVCHFTLPGKYEFEFLIEISPPFENKNERRLTEIGGSYFKFRAMVHQLHIII